MEQTVIIVIIGAAIINYLPRMFPLVFLSKINMPPVITDWLGYIPAAVLAALVVPEILLQGGSPLIGLANKKLLAAIPCFAVAVKTKSLAFTLLTGMGTMALLNALSR